MNSDNNDISKIRIMLVFAKIINGLVEDVSLQVEKR